MERRVGTVSRGIRGPIIREGDNLVEITVDSVLGLRKAKGLNSETAMLSLLRNPS